MKNIINTLAAWAAVMVGLKAGEWLWDEVLEEKADDFKGRLKSKKSKKEVEA